MLIDDAIKMLKDEKKAGVKSLILAYWTAEILGRPDDDEFAAEAEFVEEKMDWSADYEEITEMLGSRGED